MRINVSPFRFVLCALALTLWSAPAFSQRVERGFDSDTGHSNTAESNASGHSDVKAHHDSAVSDWTHDRMLYPRVGPMNRLIALQNDPRAIQHWQESYRKDYVRWRNHEGHRGEHRNRSALRRDWNIFLGFGASAGGGPPLSNIAVYPAKWTLDVTETVTGPSDTGSCLTDYLVVPIDATGAGVGALTPGPGQPNIVGLNNLYSGNLGAGGTGVCNRAPLANDDGLSATQYFSYTVMGDDGVVVTSPVTSIDGNLIAFVEGTTSAAHFHVLAWAGHDGNNDLNNRQDVLTNSVQISGGAFVLSAPLAGSGTATDLVLGSATDSLSSPYVEYSNDVAYVGNDVGQIFRIQNVFCPAWVPCAGAAPSLDSTWGTGGVLTIGGTCTGFVSGITVDGQSGNIFAGCSDGGLYAFTPAGLPVNGSPFMIGDGSSDGGVFDAPTLDTVNGWVYAETGSCALALTGCVTAGAGLGNPVLIQASVSDLTANSVATLGPGGSSFNIHAPAFNDAYFAGGAPPLLYDYSSDVTLAVPGGEIVLYGIGFTGANNAMNSGTPPVADQDAFQIGNFEISPLTEFLTTGGEDRLFGSVDSGISNNLVDFQINNFGTHADGFPNQAAANGGIENFVTEGSGTSGIIVDNTASAVGQANSIYFGVVGTGTNTNTVVKLTQVDLQ